MEEEVVYFNNGRKEFNKIADENPGYKRIYLNIKNKERITEITLSKERGDILYILSSIEKKKYTDYFKRKAKNEVVSAAKGKKEDKDQPPKRTKQTTLFDFIKK
ncbi:uncharacterized protein Eint_081990 [Encephalitozoon intestinalis ATCC 50506]|uniref:Uncharacterized protein n=1 Tax=Encephalitozoon intestinalis (strain ATCC 50506) TaxID=876142 RepID=E0S8C3_ENCIT|nr:uncharacterized protein Eint_081990 [Encephalitozoon intestinalis ATCC 50506]ADM12129.1 hypothetical protein Eint_081990 [Encephalitozoon intestinalis ATCC 50506]UTX46157.1 signal recognition particle 9 Srp9 [Encephalitozoon intestinalis]